MDTGYFSRKLFAQVSICPLDPKGVNPDLEENDLVGVPTGLCPTKPWTYDEGALMASLLLTVPP